MKKLLVREEGFVLVMVFVVLVLMVLMSLAILQNANIDVLIYGNTRLKAKAQAATEACTQVASRNVLIGDLSGQTVANPDVPRCDYAAPTISQGVTPVGYEYGKHGLKRYFARTEIDAYGAPNPPVGAFPNQERTAVIQLWQ